jgi:hypothetical protein
VTPRRILAAGWIVFLLYAYPGYLGIDGADQLIDSRVGAFSDWHPTMMTEVWRIVGWFVSGPVGMLLLQSGLLLFGSYALLRRVLGDRGAATAAACVLVAPPLMVTSAIVCAQAQLAAFGVASAACFASTKPRTRYIGLGLAAIAAGMGSGAIIAILPLVVGTFRVRDEAPSRRFVIALAAWLAIAGLAMGASRLLVDMKTDRNEVELAMSELVATRKLAREPEPIVQLRIPTTPDEREALFEARDTALRAHRLAYLHARWIVLERALGIGKRHKDWRAVYVEPVPSADAKIALRHRARHSWVQSSLIRPVTALSHTILVRPVLYAVLALVLLGVAIAKRDRDALLWLLSGIGYELALMFELVHPMYRGSHWLIVATTIGAIVLLARWRSKPTDERIGDQA